MHKCFMTIAGFPNAYDGEIIDDILMELLKLTVPMKGLERWPTSFQDHLGDRLKGLMAPMKETKLYLKAAAKQKQTGGKQASPVPPSPSVPPRAEEAAPVPSLMVLFSPCIEAKIWAGPSTHAEF